MQPVRRLAHRRGIAVVALAALAGLALTGCRSEPGVAAYVGDQTLTESQISDVIDQVNRAKTAEQRAPSRSDVVVTFVLAKTCEAVRAQKNFPLAEVSVDQVAAAEAIPADTQYARDRVAFRSCVGGIQPDSEGKATDAELRDVFDRAVANKLVDPNAPFEAVKEQIAGDQRVAQGIAYLHPLRKMTADGDISVNPRYRPLDITLSAFQDSNTGTSIPLVVMTIGEPPMDAVRDLT